MKYKVGDKVRIKSLDWYNENKGKRGFICFDYANFIPEMSRYCGEILTINRVVEEFEHYLVSECAFSWTDEMIEGLVEEETSLCEGCCSLELKYNKLTIADNICTDKVEIILQDYELKKEGDKWFAVKKKKEYPKTYEECYEILDGEQREKTDSIIVNEYRKLINARNAYWKIYGEEKGLNKPWSPDWNGELYYLYYNPTNKTKIVKGHTPNGLLAYATLVFPTEEMADAFYDNFKEEIEICKELL